MRDANWPREKRKKNRQERKKERKKGRKEESKKSNIIGITEELDQGSLHPSIKHPETDMSRPGYEPRPP